MKQLSSLSVFFPAYNDAHSLPSLIKNTYEIVPHITNDFEVIVINDGSQDKTDRLIDEYTTHYPHFVAVHHEKNRGYGGALISGFAHAKKDWVFYTDGDGQYDPNEIVLLLQKLDTTTDVVNGMKQNRNDHMIRKFVGAIYNRILHAIYPLPISDIDCDFRLIRKQYIDKISLVSHSGIICLELILKLQRAGATFAEVTVSHYERKYGRSQFFTLPNLTKTFLEHIRFYWLWKRGG